MTTIKDFQIHSKLGEGAYSSVYKVKRMTDSQEYALKKVKLMNLSEKEKQNALNEVRILASIQHPNIIAYKEAFLEETSNSLCIVMEYANNGDLYQRICEHQKKGTTFAEPEIWSLFIQMTKALKALHDLKIFHRDLKSANVFLNKDGSVKLGDLNVSKVAKKGLLYTQTGTPYYASPEVWRDMPYDIKSDVWSLGCVLYEVATLKPPFRAEDMEGLYKKVLKGYYPKIPTHYSQDLNNVIRALLQVSPHLRPSCDKLLAFPAIVKRLEDRHLHEVEEDQQNPLLNTIRIPKNLHFLTERLPKANYAPLRMKKVDKKQFLQTLNGYKDKDIGPSILEESMRASESVDSYKNDKEHGRVYLPQVAKENQQKDILKIYGARERAEKREPAAHRVKNSIPEENEADNSSNIRSKEQQELIRIRKKKKYQKEQIETENDAGAAINKAQEEREKALDRKQSNGVVHRKVAYKVHDLGQDVIFEKQNNVNSVVNNEGKVIVKPRPRHVSDGEAVKESVQAIVKRHKNQLMPLQEAGDHEVNQRKVDKLPPLNEGKYGKLPVINGHGNIAAIEKLYENSSSPNKKKLKEISKVYKMNIASTEDVVEKYEKYAVANRKERHHNASKNHGVHVSNPPDYGVNLAKYGKGYNDDF